MAALIAAQRWSVRRERPVAATGALLLACASLWLLTSGLTLSAPDLPAKLAWQRIQFAAIIPVPGLWFYLALQFSGLERRLTAGHILLLSLPPAAMLVLLPFDGLHHGFFARVFLVDRGAFQVLGQQYGPVVWVYFVYAHLQVLTAGGILGWRMIRAPGFAWRGTGLLLAVGLIVSANILDFLQIGPDLGVELTPLALLFTIPVFAFTLFRFSRMDLLPVARGTIIETMRDGLIVVDERHRVVDVNPAAAAIFGVNPASAKARHLAEVWPAWRADPEGIDENEAEAEFVRDRPGAEPEVYEVSTSMLRDLRGQATGRVLVLRDVTARRRAEVALRVSEERLRSAFQSTLVGVYQIAPDGRILFANPALAQMLGSKTSGEFRRRDQDRATELLLGGEPASSENGRIIDRITSWRGPDGRVARLRQNARPVVDGAGALQYFEGTLEDVTELVEARDELQRKARYLEALNGIVAASATHGDAQEMIAACLDRTLEALGMPAGAVWADRHWHRVNLSDETWRAVDRSGPSFRQTLKIGDRNRLPAEEGHPLAAAMEADGIRSMLAFPIVTDGRRIGGFLVGSPEARVWLEQEIRLGEAVVGEVAASLHRIHMVELTSHQDRLAAVGQLAAGIAHDFNNMLGAILLHTEMLTGEPGLSPTGLGRTQTILEQSRRAASLVSQILDFSRRSVLQKQTLDLGLFLREQVLLLERTLPETVRIGLVAADEAFPMHADATRMQQLLLNLSTNARDAMPEGGRLTISLRRAALSGDPRPFPGMPNGDWLVLDVTDTGTGIAPEVRAHLFEPFFTTKPPGKGTGLGLSQVYGIVKQHGGYIDVASAGAAGTTFTLYFPAIPAPAAPDRAGPARIQRGHGEMILVVEDEPSTRKAIGEVLERLGYEVVLAENGRQALELHVTNADRIRLVVSDLVMPEMGGEVLYNELRQRGAEVKFVMMTGYPIGGTGRLRESRGVIRLQKPIGMQALADAVRIALQPEAAPVAGPSLS